MVQFGGSRESATVNWQWLAPNMKAGTPLHKSTLFRNVNGPFLLWIFETLRKFIAVSLVSLIFYAFVSSLISYEFLAQIHKHHQDNLSTYLGFMLSTVVGVVTKFSREFSTSRNYKQIKGKKTLIDVVISQVCNLFDDILKESKYEIVRRNREIYSVAYVMLSSIGITAEENPEIGKLLGNKMKRIFILLLVVTFIIIIIASLSVVYQFFLKRFTLIFVL